MESTGDGDPTRLEPAGSLRAGRSTRLLSAASKVAGFVTRHHARCSSIGRASTHLPSWASQEWPPACHAGDRGFKSHWRREWKRAGTVTERFAKPSAFGLSRFDSCRFRSCDHGPTVGLSVANAVVRVRLPLVAPWKTSAGCAARLEAG